MRLGLATAAAVAAFVAAAPAHASTPLPWCGTSASSVDRQPDATQSYSIHVAYARTPGQADRFAQWAPRIVGDVAAFDAWWRREDSARALRFDTFPVACTTPFGALDITSLQLPQPIGGIGGAFQAIRLQLASEFGFNEPEKAYLVYLDGSTGQVGDDRVCGQGAPGGSFGLPGLAVVYLDSCTAETADDLRPIVAIHELVHVFGAVPDAAPHSCRDGHVCDAPSDLLTAALSGEPLESNLLDVGRDDYYGHAGSWPDVRDSFFLDRLDSADRAAPSSPGALRAAEDRSGLVRVSWRAATDDLGPVAYRIYQNGRFLRQTTTTSVLLFSESGGITQYGVRAVDAVGRLSPLASVRFRDGVGMVDASGRLVLDTVPPPAIGRVTIRRTSAATTVTWPAVRDAGGLRGYRIRIGTRSITVAKPTVTIAKSRLRGSVSIAAVDRAGNVGPVTVIPLRRLR